MLGIAQRVFQGKHRAPGVSEQNNFVEPKVLPDFVEIIEIGGQSARTVRPTIAAEEEIERVVPLIERASGELGAMVSVDTYKPAVARAAIEAGAVIVNDTSGLRDTSIASECAQRGAALVVMHTLAPPGRRLQDPGRYADITGEVIAFLRDLQPAEILEEDNKSSCSLANGARIVSLPSGPTLTF